MLQPSRPQFFSDYREKLKPAAVRADHAAVASEELIGIFGKEHVMADCYACTDLQSLFEEIRARFEEAERQDRSLSLMISHADGPYRYALRPYRPTCNATTTEAASGPVPVRQQSRT